MRLLIAGWQGQVARALVEAAPQREGITAVALGRPALDLCAPSSIAGALSDGRPDVAINTAAYTAVDAAEDDEAAARRLNAHGAGLIAAEAARRGAAIIHLSTDYVFDGEASGAYLPDAAPNPKSVYGTTKLEGEVAVAAANPRHVIVRTAWVHSSTGHNFVKTMLRLARDRDEVRVVADQVGSPTYAPHLATALLAIAEQVARFRDSEGDGATGDDVREAPWGVYHAAGSGQTSWADLARAVFAESEKRGGPTAKVVDIATSDYPTAAPRPKNSVLNCGSLEETFGQKLPAWEDGIAACVARCLSSDEASPAF
ncbi:MAG: dTDP-4-dehydrorhamnose reductase [Pseudomonadota bacterium]